MPSSARTGRGSQQSSRSLPATTHPTPVRRQPCTVVRSNSVRPRTPTPSGVRFVHQDLGLVLDLSAVENLMLGRRYPKGFGGRIKWRDARRVARETMARAGLDIDVRTVVGDLGVADRTRLAIARALPERDDDKVVLVLDEPTAALPRHDVDLLFGTIRRLQDAGNSIVIVSHHLDEVLGIADTITVLRDGKQVATTAAHSIDHDTLTRLIVGHALDVSAGVQAPVEASATPALRLADLSGGAVVDVSAIVYAGEIVGVAGLAGSGREVLASMVTGRLPRLGEVAVDGLPVRPGSPRAALSARVAGVSGERARYGTFPNLGVRQNLTMGSVACHVRYGRIDARKERGEVRRWISSLGIVTRGADAPMTSLSGGNQQKVLVARALRLEPRCSCSTTRPRASTSARGEQVHRIIETGATEDRAVLLVSTDSAELARICHRVLIMSRGRVVRELRRGHDLTADAIDHAEVAGAAAMNSQEVPTCQ